MIEPEAELNLREVIKSNKFGKAMHTHREEVKQTLSLRCQIRVLLYLPYLRLLYQVRHQTTIDHPILIIVPGASQTDNRRPKTLSMAPGYTPNHEYYHQDCMRYQGMAYAHDLEKKTKQALVQMTLVVWPLGKARNDALNLVSDLCAANPYSDACLSQSCCSLISKSCTLAYKMCCGQSLKILDCKIPRDKSHCQHDHFKMAK